MSADKTKNQVDLEWENRTLCSDEACIGTIGPDGRCRECGKPFDGPLPHSADQVEADTPEQGDAEQEDTLDSDGQPESEDELQDRDNDIEEDWDRRTLCSDEACIGTIGPDGRCRECGRPYEGESPLR